MTRQHEREYQRGYRDGASDAARKLGGDLPVAPRQYREGYEDGYYGARPAVPLTADCAREVEVAAILTHRSNRPVYRVGGAVAHSLGSGPERSRQ